MFDLIPGYSLPRLSCFGPAEFSTLGGFTWTEQLQLSVSCMPFSSTGWQLSIVTDLTPNVTMERLKSFFRHHCDWRRFCMANGSHSAECSASPFWRWPSSNHYS